MFNIKEIVDKILKESDVQASSYSVADRVADVNAEYLKLVERAVQIGSKTPISAAEEVSEEFTVVAGSNEFERTIPDVPIVRVDFQRTGSTLFEPVTPDPSRLIGGWLDGVVKYFADEKRFFVEEGVAGTLRVTYVRGEITLFTAADYALGSGWPTPDFLPATFQPLLWLKPAYKAAKKYNPEKAAAIADDIVELMQLFNNHYGRQSAYDSQFVTEEGERGNNR